MTRWSAKDDVHIIASERSEGGSFKLDGVGSSFGETGFLDKEVNFGGSDAQLGVVGSVRRE